MIILTRLRVSTVKRSTFYDHSVLKKCKLDPNYMRQCQGTEILSFYFFIPPPPPNATTCSYELSWFPSWLWRQCSRLLRMGRPCGATTLSRWCEWWYARRWNTRRGLKPKSTNYPDHGHHGNLSLQGKIPMVEPGIEPRTSWLVVRDPDH